MAVLASILESLKEGQTTLETFNRQGECVHRVSSLDLVDRIRAQRAAFAGWEGEDRRVALLFRPEETLEFLVATFAALAERLTVAPLYPSWTEDHQQLYLARYGLRAVAVGEGLRARVEGWRGLVDRVIPVTVRSTPARALPALEDLLPQGELFPADLPDNHPCALIFTSGTSGDLAKGTLITQANLAAAIENIAGLDFLRQQMVLHCPLSASHIFAFVVILGFLALKPRRVIFSDVQYLSRLPEEKIGKVDAMILIPLVLHRMRAAFYERLARPHQFLQKEGEKPDRTARLLTRLPAFLRRGLARLVGSAERAVIAREAGRFGALLAWPLALLAGRIFGPMVRRRLASPEFVVVGGAKPNLRAMAFLEVMGVRCLQGWGMTETTGPLAVCRLGDRFRGGFGSCGNLFPGCRAYIDGEELVVEGPQVAEGYLEPDGRLLPFSGRLPTGDHAEFDSAGRLRVLGKVSDRITLTNGLNYNPVHYEELIHGFDLRLEHVIEETVVIGDGQARLGCVFFLREPHQPSESIRRYLAFLLKEINATLHADDQLGPWGLSPLRLRDAAVLGPSAKLIRRRVEESYAHLYEGERRLELV
jgi:long-subunit acyl-CoA synthetase (AMP-forming)